MPFVTWRTSITSKFLEEQIVYIKNNNFITENAKTSSCVLGQLILQTTGLVFLRPASFAHESNNRTLMTCIITRYWKQCNYFLFMLLTYWIKNLIPTHINVYFTLSHLFHLKKYSSRLLRMNSKHEKMSVPFRIRLAEHNLSTEWGCNVGVM